MPVVASCVRWWNFLTTSNGVAVRIGSIPLKKSRNRLGEVPEHLYCHFFTRVYRPPLRLRRAQYRKGCRRRANRMRTRRARLKGGRSVCGSCRVSWVLPATTWRPSGNLSRSPARATSQATFARSDDGPSGAEAQTSSPSALDGPYCSNSREPFSKRAMILRGFVDVTSYLPERRARAHRLLEVTNPAVGGRRQAIPDPTIMTVRGTFPNTGRSEKTYVARVVVVKTRWENIPFGSLTFHPNTATCAVAMSLSRSQANSSPR